VLVNKFRLQGEDRVLADLEKSGFSETEMKKLMTFARVISAKLDLERDLERESEEMGEQKQTAKSGKFPGKGNSMSVTRHTPVTP